MQHLDIQLPKNLLDELMQLIKTQGKIVAIKHLIDHSDYNLKEAKDIVDMLEQGGDIYAKLDELQDQEGNFELYAVHAPSEFKTLRIEHDTRQLYVIFENGGKEQIDETHPRWDEIMAHFYNKSYPNIEAFFQDKAKQDHWFEEAINDVKNHEEGQTITSHYKSTSIGFQSATHEDHKPVRPQAGVEDLTKSSGKKWVMIAMVIVVIALLWLMIR